MALFDSQFIKKLEYLSLVSRRVFRGRIIAQRRTRQLGSGAEFADHRPYNFGDDLRYLDWNLFARHDQLLLKRFAEEQDLHVYIMLDCSQSMSMGDPSKFDHARRIAAALAYIALADLDRVRVCAFGGDLIGDFPMTRGKGRILALLEFLEVLEPVSTVTDLQRAVGGLVHGPGRRGPVLVVSDLYDPAGFESCLDRLRYHRYEPHVIRVFDPRESQPQLLGDMELVDIETQSACKVTVTEQNLRQYAGIYEKFTSDLRQYCLGNSLGLTEASTHVAYDELILNMMRRGGTLA